MNVAIQAHLYHRAPHVFSHAKIHFFVVETDENRTIFESTLLSSIKKNEISAAIIDSKPFSSDFFKNLPKLFLLIRFGIGTENINKKICQERNILVKTTPDSASISCAEYTIALMMTLAKKIAESNFSLKSGQWKRMVHWELEGKTLGILGLGRIGTQVARIASQGLRMRVLGWCRPEKKCISLPWIDEIFDDIQSIAEKSDVISLHLSLNPQTLGIVNQQFFNAIKKKCLFINIARAALVNQNDFMHALNEKKIVGAAIDVFPQEPYEIKKEELHKWENVVLTPHIAGNSSEANARTAQKIVEILVNHINENEKL